MKVLVTGGAGFIGANVVRRLLATPEVDEVVVLDDLSSGSAGNLADLDVGLVTASVLDLEAVTRAATGASAIVHLAARPSVPRSILEPVAAHAVNATGTLQVLEAARHSPTAPLIVFASSSSVYGATSVSPKHEQLAPGPLSPYAASKLAGEAYVRAYSHSYDLPVLALRFFNVFGPLQSAGHAYAAVIPAFIARALAGQPVVIHGDGMQTRDFTFVDSVSEVLVRAVTNRVTSPAPVNLAFGSSHSLLDVVGLLSQLLARPVAVHHVEPRAGDVRDSQADTRKLREFFPDVQPVPLLEGLRATVAWNQRLAKTAT